MIRRKFGLGKEHYVVFSLVVLVLVVGILSSVFAAIIDRRGRDSIVDLGMGGHTLSEIVDEDGTSLDHDRNDRIDFADRATSVDTAVYARVLDYDNEGWGMRIREYEEDPTFYRLYTYNKELRREGSGIAVGFSYNAKRVWGMTEEELLLAYLRQINERILPGTICGLCHTDNPGAGGLPCGWYDNNGELREGNLERSCSGREVCPPGWSWTSFGDIGAPAAGRGFWACVKQ